jgi:hypothetical protein
MRVRAAIDHAQAEHAREDREEILAAEERSELEKCDKKFERRLEAAEAEWRRQAQFTRPSAALAAMRKTAERLIAAGKYDKGSGIARQIAEREAEEARMAQRRIAEARAANIAEITAQRAAARAAITALFEQRRHPTVPRPTALPPLRKEP